MRIHAGSSHLEGQLGPNAIAIGIFDGLHMGHQALLGKAVELAARDEIESLAYSFHPHPAQIMAPELAPHLIETTDYRIERFAALGLDTALIEPFDREFASMEAETFVRELLVSKLQARHVIVGRGFSFGFKKKGDVQLLEQRGAELGFEVHPIPPVKVNGIHVSSTKIREFVNAGRMRGAALLLGRPYELHGTVIRGDGRGATIGFATANITPENELLPGVGVYAVMVSGNFAEGKLPAVINVGYTPTFGSLTLKIEAHILDFEPRPLYGAAMSVEFLIKLRDEQRFDGIDSLTAQIAVDVGKARDVFSNPQKWGIPPTGSESFRPI